MTLNKEQKAFRHIDNKQYVPNLSGFGILGKGFYTVGDRSLWGLMAQYK